MAIFKLKRNNKILQVNNGDTEGNIVQSFNIDTHTKPGKICLSRPLNKVVSSAVADDRFVAGFGQISASGSDVFVFLTNLTEVYKILKSESPYTTWEDVTDGDSVSVGDIVVFDGQMVMTEAFSNIDAFDGVDFTNGWWTARGNPALTASSTIPKILETSYIGAEKLFVTDGNKVHGYVGGIDSGAVSSVTVDLGGDFIATCLKSSIRRMWIGTFTEDSNEARVFEWSGESTNYTQSYPVGTKGVLAMEIVNDVPLIVTDTGEIKMFNNVGFTTIARFPFTFNANNIDGLPQGDFQQQNRLRPIHPKGIKKIKNLVYIYVNWKDDNLPLDEKTPAGLWVLNLDTYSLTHLNSIENRSVLAETSPIFYIEGEDARMFLGGKTNDDTDNLGLWVEQPNSSNTKWAHFTTIEYEADSIADAFEYVILKANLGSSDSVVVKYRVETDKLLPIMVKDCVWASANSFNTTADLSRALERFNNKNYDEVEILDGPNAGKLPHITNITFSGNTYQVTIDENIGVAGDKLSVSINNWKRVPTEYTTVNGDRLKFGIGEVSTFCQLRVYMEGTNGYPEIRDLILKSNNKEST